MPKLIFNAEDHTYTLGGRRLPSVTEILRPLEDFSGVPREILDRAAEFGRHVHMAIALDSGRQLDETSLDPELAPYLGQWRRFLAESGARVLASEMQVFHSGLRYAGTLDVLALWRDQRCIIDIKTGQVPRSVGAQVEAYRMAYQSQECGGFPGRRYCVQLDRDAYKVHSLTDPADWSLFQSCLNIWRFRNG